MKKIVYFLFIFFSFPLYAEESPSIKFAKGVWLLKNNHIEEGIELLDDSCFSDFLPSCYELFNYYYNKGELESSLDYLNQIVSLEEKPSNELIRLLVNLSIKQGNYFLAIRNLKLLESKGQELSLEYGVTLFLLGQESEAIPYLKKAIINEIGDRNIIARLYLAEVYLKKKDVDKALDLLLPVRDKFDDIEDIELRKKAEEIFDSVFKSTSYLPYGFSASLSLSVGYNTNPVYDPMSAGKESGSPGLDINGRIGIEPFGNYYYSIGDFLQLTRRQFFFERAKNFNLSILNNNFYIRSRFFLKNIYEMTLNYRTVLLMLDGGELLEELYPYIFLESHTGSVSLSIEERSWLSTKVSLEGGARFYHNKGRSGYIGSLRGGQNIFLLRNKLKIYIEAGFDIMESKNKAYSYISPLVSFALSWLTPFGSMEVILSSILQWFDYYDSKGFFDPIHIEKEREELWFLLNFAIFRRYYKHYRAGLNYQLSIMDSTIENFSYIQHIIYVTLEAGF